EVRSINLKYLRGTVKVQVSYLDGALLVSDYPPGQTGRPTKLVFEPGWAAGHQYKVESTSLGLLRKLDIQVHTR
ncbi:MAG TPA: hypothetical protein VJ995_09215, partial [Geothermobacteraceae bacterium]|nr:hypothetical protein [Geothermobacteraceae bacterium]